MLELSNSLYCYEWEGCWHWIENTICSIIIYAQTLPPLVFFDVGSLVRSLLTRLFTSATIYIEIGRVIHTFELYISFKWYRGKSGLVPLFHAILPHHVTHFCRLSIILLLFLSFYLSASVYVLTQCPSSIHPSNSIRDMMIWRVLMDIAARYLYLDSSLSRSPIYLILSFSRFLWIMY